MRFEIGDLDWCLDMGIGFGDRVSGLRFRIGCGDWGLGLDWIGDGDYGLGLWWFLTEYIVNPSCN